VVGLATDLLLAKRDGIEAEASLTCRGQNHEEQKVQEGWVERHSIKSVLVKKTDSSADESPEDDKRRESEHPR
jgi:hypothetical protein